MASHSFHLPSDTDAVVSAGHSFVISTRKSRSKAATRSKVATAVPVVPGVMRLPPEMVCKIFNHLSLPDIIRFAGSCLRFHDICMDSAVYVVQRLLHRSGRLLMQPRVSPFAAPVHLQLPRVLFENLLQTDYGMRYITPPGVHTYGVVNRPSNVIAVADGFLIHAQNNAVIQFHGFSCAMLFYARDFSAPVMSFHVFFPVVDIYAMAIEPCMDLLVILAPVMENAPAGPVNHHFQVMFRKLSSAGSPHPNAPQRISFRTRFDPRTPRQDTTSRALPAGDLLLLHLANTSEYQTAFVGLMNWQDGQDSMITIRLQDGMVDIAWICLYIFIVTSLSGSIYVFRVVSRSPITIHLMAVFWIPDVKANQSIDIFSAVTSLATTRLYNGLPGVESTYETSFARTNNIVEPVERSDPSRGLLVLTLATSGDDDVDENAYTAVFLLSDFLEHMATEDFLEIGEGELMTNGDHAPTTLLDWRVFEGDLWFSFRSRHFRNLDLNDFTNAVVGTRMLSSCGANNPLVATAMADNRPDGQALLRDCTVLLEFNPETLAPPEFTNVMPAVATSIEGAGDWAPVAGTTSVQRIVSRPTIIQGDDPTQRVFADDIVGVLPYRQVASRPQASVSSVVLDECRMWFMSWFSVSETAFWEMRAFNVE